MKIGILSQWYDPEPGPASLPGVYAREFVRRGHDVSVLTGFPNYPSGKLHDGYRIRRRTFERVDDVKVTRVAIYPSHSSSAIGRVANYSSFALSAWASGRSAMRDADVVWVYNSPVTVSLPLLRHTRGGKTPFFLHVQDLWPDSLVESGMMPGGWLGSSASAVVARVVRLTEDRATTVGVSSRTMRDVILERHPRLDPSKVVYAPNPTNENLFRPAHLMRDALGIPREPSQFVELMYAGAVGEVQGLDTLLDAAALLRGQSHIQVSLVGDGISLARLQRRVVDEKLYNVRILGRVSQDAIPSLIARAHIQLVSLADAPFLSYTTPSKISALLASGVPIIGHLSGDGARLVQDAGAGAVVTPGDAVGLSEAIVKMVGGGPQLWDSLGASGRTYYETHLSTQSTADKILRSVLPAKQASELKDPCEREI